MTVYLIHFDRPIGDTSTRYGYAQHYTGSAFARRLIRRMAEHATHPDAKIMAAVREAGIGWTLARTWSGGHDRERQLKQCGAARRCPVCQGREPQLDAPGSQPYRAPGRTAAAEAAKPATPPAGWTRPPEPEPEPLEDSIVARLDPVEAAALVAALDDGQRAAWQRATTPGPDARARFETACEAARISGQEARAAQRLAEAREIAAADEAAYQEAARRQAAPELAVLAAVRERRSERETAPAAGPVARREPQLELEAG